MNATSVGLRPTDSLDGLPLVDASVVVDLVYGAAQTPFARWAEERGARVVDGLEVLVRQGARSLAALDRGGAPRWMPCAERLSSPSSSTYAQV